MVEQQNGIARLYCPFTTADWQIPYCGNAIRETGEECDNRSRDCTDTCQRRLGVDCAEDDSVCLCDPVQYPTVFTDTDRTGYYSWLDLDGPKDQWLAYENLSPGKEFQTHGEVGFDCSGAMSAPQVAVPPGVPHQWVIGVFREIDASLVAAAEYQAARDWRYYPIDQWLGRVLLVKDSGGALFKLQVANYEGPCLGNPESDSTLTIDYDLEALTCPEGFTSEEAAGRSSATSITESDR